MNTPPPSQHYPTFLGRRLQVNIFAEVNSYPPVLPYAKQWLRLESLTGTVADSCGHSRARSAGDALATRGNECWAAGDRHHAVSVTDTSHRVAARLVA